MREFHAAVLAVSAMIASSAGAQFLPPQSPINLVNNSKPTGALPALTFNYYNAAPLRMENTGSPDDEETIKLHIAEPKLGGTLRIAEDPRLYVLKQFHFHIDSEHTLYNRHRAMEMHMVHQGPDGENLAVGRWITVQADDNPDFESIFGNLPGPDDPDVDIAAFNLTKLFPPADSRQSYRYSGSLTAPLDPLLQVSFVPVSWIMLSEPIGLSQAQIDEFEDLFFNGNSREIQDTNEFSGHNMITDVVPAPGTLAAVGLGALLAARRRRT